MHFFVLTLYKAASDPTYSKRGGADSTPLRWAPKKISTKTYTVNLTIKKFGQSAQNWAIAWSFLNQSRPKSLWFQAILANLKREIKNSRF